MLGVSALHCKRLILPQELQDGRVRPADVDPAQIGAGFIALWVKRVAQSQAVPSAANPELLQVLPFNLEKVRIQLRPLPANLPFYFLPSRQSAGLFCHQALFCHPGGSVLPSRRFCSAIPAVLFCHPGGSEILAVLFCHPGGSVLPSRRFCPAIQKVQFCHPGGSVLPSRRFIQLHSSLFSSNISDVGATWTVQTLSCDFMNRTSRCTGQGTYNLHLTRKAGLKRQLRHTSTSNR